MTPELAIREAESGSLRPVYLITGEERFFVDQVATAIRKAATAGDVAGFNEDKFTAGEATADAVVGAANMLPMMAPRRLVLVRSLERWEPKQGDSDKGKKDKRATLPPLDRLAEYAASPCESTVMVLLASKLHGQRKLVTLAKKQGFGVQCDPLHRRDLPHWISAEAKLRGHKLASGVADLIAELTGPELPPVADALNRLSLYVGENEPITEAAVAETITRIRQKTVWELVDAVSARRLERALSAVAEVCDPRDGGLRLLGLIGWSVRQLVKFDAGLQEGLDPAKAAQRAGMAPFKARDAQQTLKRMPPGTLDAWIAYLTDADLALKGSKRPAISVLEAMVVQMCTR